MIKSVTFGFYNIIKTRFQREIYLGTRETRPPQPLSPRSVCLVSFQPLVLNDTHPSPLLDILPRLNRFVLSKSRNIYLQFE